MTNPYTQQSPAPQSSSGGGEFAGLTVPPPPSTSGSSSGGDKYGLGAWAGATINPGDLPLLASIIAKGNATTGDAVMEAFAQADPTTLAEIQRALYLGGFYGTSKTSTPTYGVLNSGDISAFGKAVRLAGESGQSLSELILTHAKAGVAMGVAAAQQQIGTTASAHRTVVVNVPSTGDLEAVAMRAFENVLGRKATPKEAAQFASLYQSMAAGVERGNAAAQQQSAQQQAGSVGITQQQATGFDNQLAQIGRPVATSAQPLTFRDELQAGKALPSQPTEPGFGEQLGQLQSLGQSVTHAAAGRVPPVSGGTTVLTQQQPESATVAAENFARSEHPHGAARADLGGALDMFLGLIGSKFGA